MNTKGKEKGKEPHGGNKSPASPSGRSSSRSRGSSSSRKSTPRGSSSDRRKLSFGADDFTMKSSCRPSRNSHRSPKSKTEDVVSPNPFKVLNPDNPDVDMEEF